MKTEEKTIDNKWVTTLRALVYYVSTTLIAVIIGVLIVTIMKPGVGRGESINSHISSDAVSQAKTISTVDTVLDLFRYFNR